MTDPPRGGTGTLSPARPHEDTAGGNLTIGQLAREFNITTRTIRFYEARGLMQPVRRGATRTFGAADRRRLALIMRAKNLGLSLEQIGEHLSLFYDRPQDRPTQRLMRRRIEQHLQLLGCKKVALVETMRELQHIKKELAAHLTSAIRARS